MTKDLNETIIKLANLAEAEKVVVYTSAFKVYGKLLRGKDKIEKDITTLLDATLCRHFNKCDCACSCGCETVSSDDDECICYEWINIPDEKIVSFSILPA